MTNDTMTYDEALRRLEDLVSQLERGGKNLDETLAMFEEAPPCSSDAKNSVR